MVKKSSQPEKQPENMHVNNNIGQGRKFLSEG
jgi:hypothetical protein